MKVPLSVGAALLTLAFSAYAEPQQHVALLPDFYKCFDLLRLESLQHNYETGKFRINTSDPNQMELLHSYFSVTGSLRGYFTAMNVSRSINGLAPDATNGTTQKEWMPWIFSYCRSHPTENIEGVADELVQAFSSKTP